MNGSMNTAGGEAAMYGDEKTGGRGMTADGDKLVPVHADRLTVERARSYAKQERLSLAVFVNDRICAKFNAMLCELGRDGLSPEQAADLLGRYAVMPERGDVTDVINLALFELTAGQARIVAKACRVPLRRLVSGVLRKQLDQWVIR